MVLDEWIGGGGGGGGGGGSGSGWMEVDGGWDGVDEVLHPRPCQQVIGAIGLYQSSEMHV